METSSSKPTVAQPSDPVAGNESTFAAHLIALRKRAELSVEDAAGKAELPPGTWAAMEAGNVWPATSWLRPMAIALDVEPSEIL